MQDLILHHYPMSPFAQKIRSVLGYKQLAWKSVFIPSIMPKPDVVALTGGYRKTPFLQIGADIYCDSALICDVLEHIKPEPSIYPATHKGLARVVSEWADTALFRNSMAFNFQPASMAQLFGNAPPEAAKAFAEDRKAMSAGMSRIRPGDGTSAYKSYLRRLASMLEGQDFLLGSTPCVADFSAYQCVWFTRTQASALAGILEATPTVVAWADRMAAFGQGSPEKFSATEAIAVAGLSTPALDGSALKNGPHQDDHGIALGEQVTISPESFGTEASAGELVAATRTHYTLRRTDPRAGTVQVHFPRSGYVLKKAEA